MTLEELLNKLIQMGWKPRGYESDEVNLLTTQSFEGYDKNRKLQFHHKLTCIWSDFYSLRDLVSIESGFRQFVCENDLYNRYDIKKEYLNNINLEIYDANYRLMLSSIHTDIEKFILDNILIHKQ